MIDETNMPHRFLPIIDTLMSTVMALIASSSTLILAQSAAVEGPSKIDSIFLLLLPLIGALLVSIGVINLNPKQEEREKIIGRSTIAVFFSAVGPSSIALLHPSLKIITEFPVLLLLAGGLIFGLIYILSRPIVEKIYNRSSSIAENAINAAQYKFFTKSKEERNSQDK